MIAWGGGPRARLASAMASIDDGEEARTRPVPA